MRIKLLCCLMVFLLVLPVAAKPPKGDYTAPSVAIIDNTTFISANRILMFVTNHGNFGRDLGGIFGHDYGTWYPYPVGQDTALINGSILQQYTPNYASGLWVGAIDSASGNTRIIISEYDSEYVPGYMTGTTFTPDRSEFRVYKLFKDSLLDNPNQDYIDYMTYGEGLGAPFWDEDTYKIDSSVIPWDSTLLGLEDEPQVFGDQFLWTVYNDADPDQHQNDAGTTPPLGLEVKQSLFAFNRDDPLGDVVFMRYRVYNKGTSVLENCYFSLWCDPDVGGSGDDLVGCDTTLGLGFAYNGDNDDSQYGENPPCWAFDFFQGPMIPGEVDDTAIMWNFQKFPGMKNLGMTSFNKYINGTDPDNFNQTYWFMEGKTKTGADYVYDGQTLKFVLSGDVVAGTGDLDFGPDDRRWMQTTGPITFRPGDSTEIVAASIAAQAVDRKTAISLMKFYDRFAQLTYDSAFVVLEPPARPVVSAAKEAGVISLYWNDTSQVDPGNYSFEGYAIEQGESPAGPWHRITNIDIANQVEDVFDEQFDPTTGVPEIRLIYNGTNSGIREHLTIAEDVITGLPINDVTTYHYRVTAYTTNLTGPLGLKTMSSAATISIAPQAPPAGVEFGASIEDVLPVTHAAGVSGGVITPIVVDPDALTGDVYRIIFKDTLGFQIDTLILDPINAPFDTTFDSTNVAWFLINVDNDDTLLYWQGNQTNDEDYDVTEGFKVKVSGPPPGFNNFMVTENNCGPVDPPQAAAAEWQGFPVPLDADGNNTRPEAGVQQCTGDGRWLFHTGDDGGTSGGGTRGSYAAFLTRVLRDDPVRISRVGIYDFEMRFTGDIAAPDLDAEGSWAWEWATDGTSYWVPFEVWRTGVGTPDDDTDDLKLLAYIFGEGDAEYNIGAWGGDPDCGPDGCEHSVSSGDDDPYTNWVYWRLPADETAGTAGYDAYEAEVRSDPLNRTDDSGVLMGRTVLVLWNGGVEAPFVMDMPEQGTVFRLTTAKPNAAADIFEFTPPAKTFAASESALDDIKAVPNPYYLRSGFDPNPGASAINFHHLPQECSIRIYNLGGDLIRTLYKDDADAVATWDASTENGLPVSSGIYIYVVEAPGFGTKVGKLAVFIQQEVLDIY